MITEDFTTEKASANGVGEGGAGLAESRTIVAIPFA